MNPSLSWSLLCSLLLSGVVSCMLLNDSLLFTNGRNLTASQPISVLTDSDVHCTPSVAWTGTDELSLSFFQDCGRAIYSLFDKDVWPHGLAEFEFLGDGSVPVHHNPQQRTPRRYSFGKSRKVATCSKNKAHATVPGLGICTVAIINKPDIPQAYWPGPSLGVEPKTDVASYDEIYYALRAMGDHCLTLRSEVGWVLAGQLYLPFVVGSGNILTKIGW